jgi:hypothetical protein
MEKDIHLPVFPDPDFADRIPSMYSAFGSYVINVIPLMLDHARQEVQQKNITAEQALLQSGWIGRLITLDTRVLHAERQDDVPGWAVVRDTLIDCIRERADERFVEYRNRSIEFLQPLLASRFIEGYQFPKQKFHCWWWTIHDDETNLALHLINAYQPSSPFQNLGHFLQTMLEAVGDAIAHHPRIKYVSCGSWLNQLPKFQALWPASFQINQRILNTAGGFGPGAWGQYMTTNGGFSNEKAALLRSTGKHPFPLTEGQCSIDELKEHLEKLIFLQR